MDVASRTTVPTPRSRMHPSRYCRSGDSGVVSTERGIGISSSPMRLPAVPMTPARAPSERRSTDSTMYETEVLPLVPVIATMSIHAAGLAVVQGGGDGARAPGVRDPYDTDVPCRRGQYAAVLHEDRGSTPGEGGGDGSGAAFHVPRHRDEERSRHHPVRVEGGSGGDVRLLRVTLEDVVVLSGQQLAQLQGGPFEGWLGPWFGRRRNAATAVRRSCGGEVERVRGGNGAREALTRRGGGAGGAPGRDGPPKVASRVRAGRGGSSRARRGRPGAGTSL